MSISVTVHRSAFPEDIDREKNKSTKEDELAHRSLHWNPGVLMLSPRWHGGIQLSKEARKRGTCPSSRHGLQTLDGSRDWDWSNAKTFPFLAGGRIGILPPSQSTQFIVPGSCRVYLLRNLHGKHR